MIKELNLKKRIQFVYNKLFTRINLKNKKEQVQNIKMQKDLQLECVWHIMEWI